MPLPSRATSPRASTVRRALAMAVVLAAAAAAAAPAWAAQDFVADVNANAGTPQDTQKVALTAGRDYVVYSNGTAGRVVVRDPQGRTLASLPGDTPQTFGFRAADSAAYVLKAQAGDGFAQAVLYTDCRADTQTRCKLVPGVEAGGFEYDAPDVDWYRVSLKKGQRYRFSAQASTGAGLLTLRSPAAKLIQRVAVPGEAGGSIDYVAPTTGTYFLATSIDTSQGADPYTYLLSVSRK